MSNEFANKIKRLELENFTCFGKVAMDFSPGINVFIGENGTGKTHLLKVLYSLVKRDFQKRGNNYSVKENFFGNLISVFKNTQKGFGGEQFLKSDSSNPEGLLIHATINNMAFVTGGIQDGLMWNDSTKPEINVEEIEALYLPPGEMLSWSKGFISQFLETKLDFDRTYFDLAIALDRPEKRNELQNGNSFLIGEIDKSIKLKVSKKEDGRFYITEPGKKREFEASWVATGIVKIAQIKYLWMNGSLTKDTILFWDEPEAGLNPKYIKPVAQFLMTLANAGCQVFVATHDYLLPYELSLAVEYADAMKKEAQRTPPMKFFTLMKGENGTTVESGDTMYDLPYDAIMEGHLQFHEKREQLQRNSINQPT